MQLGLLLCDHIDRDFRRTGGDYPDLFLDRIREVMPSARLRVFDAEAGELPAPETRLDGWIISGARHDAFGDYPWLVRLKARVHELLAAGEPRAAEGGHHAANLGVRSCVGRGRGSGCAAWPGGGGGGGGGGKEGPTTGFPTPPGGLGQPLVWSDRVSAWGWSPANITKGRRGDGVGSERRRR
ncbi:hypothetical protein CGX12_15210, partial [Zobellella denitrificans]